MKQKLKKLAHQLWIDESGQGTLEYALICGCHCGR